MHTPRPRTADLHKRVYRSKNLGTSLSEHYPLTLPCIQHPALPLSTLIMHHSVSSCWRQQQSKNRRGLKAVAVNRLALPPGQPWTSVRVAGRSGIKVVHSSAYLLILR